MKVLLAAILILISSCSVLETPGHRAIKNHPVHMDAPVVLLISIDGFRHDYVKLYKPPFLSRFFKEGATAKGLRPVFPSKTFPNHLSIMTGRYAESHGIVSNQFYAPDLGQEYSLGDKSSVRNTNFYLSPPLWALAEAQGMVSAPFFWPGSEAPYEGIIPTYNKAYQHGMSGEKKIETIIDWMKRPKTTRPHFVTLYFHDVDSAGHRFGPKSVEVKNAIMKVDQHLKRLDKKLKELPYPVNTIIVSDHGMKDLTQRTPLALEHLIGIQAFSQFKDYGYGPVIQFYFQGEESKKQDEVQKLLRKLQSHSQHGKSFMAYHRLKVPGHYHFKAHSRVGDLVVVAKGQNSIFVKKSKAKKLSGNHGYDPYREKDMWGIFSAKGPQIEPMLRLEAISNIHVYPFIAKLLGLKIKHQIDGDIKKLNFLIKE